MNRYTWAVAIALLVALGIVSPASAHTPSYGADCKEVYAQLSNAPNNYEVTITVTVGTQSKTVTTSNGQGLFRAGIASPQGGATTPWSINIDARDRQYDRSDSGTVGPCGETPPPTVDVPPQPEVVPPTCEEDGYAIGVTYANTVLTVDGVVQTGSEQTYGVGDHLFVYTPAEGFVFSGEDQSVEYPLTALPATGYQSDNPEAPCYEEPENPEEPPTEEPPNEEPPTTPEEPPVQEPPAENPPAQTPPTPREPTGPPARVTPPTTGVPTSVDAGI